LTAPVEGSLWGANTTSMPGAAASASATPCGSSAGPHSPSWCSTSSPWSFAIDAHLLPKWPQEATITRSPGRARLATADDMAPVPDAA